MVELIAYCVYATLPPRGPRVANAKRFCYSVCQLFGTSLWFYFLFFFFVFGLFCSAILVLMGKVFWFLAGKVPPFAVAYWDFCDSAGRWIQWNPLGHNDHNFCKQSQSDVTSHQPALSVLAASKLQCSATQSKFITHTRRGTKPSFWGEALSSDLSSFCSSRRAVVHFQFA